MKILLDECIDVRFRNHLTGHDAFTVEYMKWKGIGNGQLLSLAAAQKFDVMLTVGKGTRDELPPVVPIAVLVVRVKRNTRGRMLPLVPKILASLSNLTPGTIRFVE